jgi:N-omega-hydroxy-L-arginine synthase
MNQATTYLIAQAQLSEQSLGWHWAVLQDLEVRLRGDSGFPCIFAKNAFWKQLFRFIFVDSIDAPGIQRLALGLREYVDLSRDWDGSLDTAYPLVVAFSREAIRVPSVEASHAFGWNVLQQLHEIDPNPWPEDVSRDPESSAWSMCFNGMPLFVNMSSPAHETRRSRNLGDHFTLIINPRERFDVFAGDTPGGRKVRANIRNRIHRYDGVPHALQLSSYGAGGNEWWQYGLVEENVERTDRCPFLFSGSVS